MFTEIYKFPLFKKFRAILSNYFNIDLLIVVQKDNKFFYEKSKKVANPVVKILLQSSVFRNHFFSSFSNLKKSLKEFKEIKNTFWKQTGLDLWVIPLSFDKNSVNSYKFYLVAVGFPPKNKKKLKQAFSYLGLSEKESQKKIQDLNKLNHLNLVYIQEMLKILSEEFFSSVNPFSKKKDGLEKKHLHTYGFMRGCSPAMQYVFNVLKKLKNYDGYVLIEGERGTGKRLLAKTIHQESLRAHKSFQVQNFSVFHGSFLESTLFFNHSEDSKAFRHKKSLAQKLEGGTLLLNEIGKTSLEFQKNLLRFLKSSQLFRQGELKNKKYNVRIISTTSDDLRELVKKGEFIDSLYFAISAMSINIPPLRYRKMDIPVLVDYFINQKSPHKYIKFSKEAFKLLHEYPWPGNIFELEAEVEKAISFMKKDQTFLTEKDLSPHIRNFSERLDGVYDSYKNSNLKDVLDNVEKQVIFECLRRNNWNKSRVAKILGISRTSLIFKTKEYGLFKEGA